VIYSEKPVYDRVHLGKCHKQKIGRKDLN